MTMPSVLPRLMNCSGGEPEPELPEGALVLPPVPADRHRELEEDLDPEERLELSARGGTDPLEHAAAAADDNGLLGLLLDEDHRPDVEAFGPRPLHQLLDAHGGSVRDFLVGQLEDLLADDLGGVERLGLVRHRICRKEGG